MSIINDVLQGVNPLNAILQIGNKIIDRVVVDPLAKDAAKLELAKLEQSGDLQVIAHDVALAQGQIETNKIEAGNGNLFVSGWRPATGWVCNIALAYHYILQPLISFGLSVFGHIVVLPAFNMDNLLTILLGMLGLGGMRTFEKYKGVNKK